MIIEGTDDSSPSHRHLKDETIALATRFGQFERV